MYIYIYLGRYIAVSKVLSLRPHVGMVYVKYVRLLGDLPRLLGTYTLTIAACAYLAVGDTFSPFN